MFNDTRLLYNNPKEQQIYDRVWEAYRVTRAQKLVSILGIDWFENKNILEMGCSSGNIGHYLKSLSANVSYCDVREEVLDLVRDKDPTSDIFVLDQETNWSLDKHYDLIIHFGLVYNIDNWIADLTKALLHTNILALETATSKYSCCSEFKIQSSQYGLHGPGSGTGTLVSSKNIENVFDKEGARYTRYDDADINIGIRRFNYDWKEDQREPVIENNIISSWWDNPHYGGRRFWIAHK